MNTANQFFASTLGFISPFFLEIYPAATFALSVRLLKSDYAGSCIRVRRSSDDTESDIGFTGNNLDTTSLLSFVGAGNGFIRTWYDQSGNANDYNQTTNANQPQIVSSGSLIVDDNGKPTVTFNGSTHFLEGPHLDLYNNFDAFSVLAAMKADPVSASYFFAEASTSSNAPIMGAWLSGSTIGTELNIANFVRNDSNGNVLTYSTLGSGSSNDFSLRFNSMSKIDSQRSHFENKVEGVSSPGTYLPGANVVTTNKNAIGCLLRSSGSAFYKCELSEIILYDSNKRGQAITMQNIQNRYFNFI